MKKLFRIFLMFAVATTLSISFAACSDDSDSPIVGKWLNEEEYSPYYIEREYWTIEANGKFEMWGEYVYIVNGVEEIQKDDDERAFGTWELLEDDLLLLSISGVEGYESYEADKFELLISMSDDNNTLITCPVGDNDYIEWKRLK